MSKETWNEQQRQNSERAFSKPQPLGRAFARRTENTRRKSQNSKSKHESANPTSTVTALINDVIHGTCLQNTKSLGEPYALALDSSEQNLLRVSNQLHILTSERRRIGEVTD